MDKFVFIKEDGSEIWCYGKIELDSNFSICCDDEEYDGIVADIDTDVQNTWTKICNYLLERYRKDITQITTI